MAGAVLLLVITLVVVNLGVGEVSGEAFLAWGYLAFLLSLPTTALFIWLYFELPWWDNSPLADSLYWPIALILVIVSVLLNWALIGMVLGAIVDRIRGRGRKAAAVKGVAGARQK